MLFRSILRGGTGEAVKTLLDYLQASHVSFPLVWIPADPAEAASLSGLYDGLATGLERTDLKTDGSDAQWESRVNAYRVGAPWGRAVIL